MTRFNFFQYLDRYGLEAGLFAAYFIVGRVELGINPVDTFATLFWLPAGITLAAVFLYGYRLWPVVALAAFAVALSAGGGFFAALGIAAGETLQALAGAYFLKKYAGFDPRLARLHDSLGLIAAAFASTLAGSAISAASVWLGGSIGTLDALSLWGALWAAGTLGTLVTAPFILKWFSVPLFKRTPLQYAELCAAAAAVLAAAVFIFWMSDAHFVYYLFIPLTWMALRTGPRGITLALFVAALAAISGTIGNYGAYEGQGLYIQVFVGIMSALFLILTSTVEERKGAQASLGRHVAELEEALSRISSEDRAKKDFLSILAHELRNPLAAILSSTELLRLQQVHAPETAALLQAIDGRVRSMTVMLDDLLDISRISHNKLLLRKEPLSLDAIIDRSVRTAQALIRSRGHALSVKKPEHELYLEADPIRLEQILVNLLNNAAKYTNQNGAIVLAAKKESGAAIITISDNGIGISKNTLARIFDPFFQVERGRLPTQGLGIGLPLTRQLVELHGGTIEATSQGEGKGSQFTVRLPLPARIQPPPAAIPQGKPRGGVLRHVRNARSILVVDDNEMAADALARLLELRGHTVSVAYNGAEAVRKARELHPDIIILDIGLPDIDGYEVARTLKKDKHFSSGLIALTGYAQPEDKERAREAGFHAHCTKPAGLKELEAAFRKVH